MSVVPGWCALIFIKQIFTYFLAISITPCITCMKPRCQHLRFSHIIQDFWPLAMAKHENEALLLSKLNAKTWPLAIPWNGKEQGSRKSMSRETENKMADLWVVVGKSAWYKVLFIVINMEPSCPLIYARVFFFKCSKILLFFFYLCMQGF